MLPAATIPPDPSASALIIPAAVLFVKIPTLPNPNEWMAATVAEGAAAAPKKLIQISTSSPTFPLPLDPPSHWKPDQKAVFEECING
eukprot:CAMPEP_0184310640 /NCGR_PEP_ID=MMETSP1049-20130417/32573_1 /TAXON_ID=77928 /ORGANISM="Proteomonas sulcata, Strain CCMP704" /LENGTH=86 /DNA_ID=CAMNT_0026625081 /DNA_START=305 /DNA_END=563 /DNA_ORIENTATION=-